MSAATFVIVGGLVALTAVAVAVAAIRHPTARRLAVRSAGRRPAEAALVMVGALARQAGMHPSTRLHDVRHVVATELGRRGVHAVIVSAVLGHASPAFTVAVYQHAWQDGPREAALALEAALGPRLSRVGNPLANSAMEPSGSGIASAK